MTASDPRAVIAAIRQKWLRMDPEAKNELSNLASHLAEKLYPLTWTFLRELVQNADDCDYPSGTTPRLTLRRLKDAFELESNELGFEEKHVRAVCSFARSTKVGQKWRFIGEKGLGFKAVFRVTDRPAIHSGGYHFQFHVTANYELGRVTPEWLDGYPDLPGTRIVLPFKADLPPLKEDPDPLSEDRCLLLFLRQLSTVEYFDEVRHRSVMLERTTDGSLICVARVAKDTRAGSRPPQQKTVHRFKVRTNVANVKGIGEKERKEVEESPVSVAIPITADGRVKLDAACWWYAYLPVAKSGLRFAFNADLLLDTARSAELEDSRWNFALAQAVGRCLADAVEDHCKLGVAGARALGMLRRPQSAEQRLFITIFQTAVDALRTRACVPTAAGEWVRPSAVVTPDGKLSQLVDPHELWRQAGVHLMHPEIAEVATEVELLGARKFGLTDLLKCLDDAAWMKTRPSEWFKKLYSALDGVEFDSAELAKLKRAALLRMNDGTTRSVAEQQAFFPLGSEHEYGFEHSIPLLAAEAYDFECEDFLAAIGVQRLTPRTVIDKYILPQHEDRRIQQVLSDNLVIAHTCYIIDHIDSYGSSADSRGGNPIGKIMVSLGVLTRSSRPHMRVRHKASTMYLGAAYADPYKLEERWGKRMPERFISPLYKDAPAPKGVPRDWVKFFRALRARDTPAFTLSKSGEPFHYGWAAESRALFQGSEESQIWDFLRIVGSAWKVYAEPMSRRLEPLAATALVRDLRSIEVSTTRGRALLAESLLDTRENREVFGDDQPYLLSTEAASVFKNEDFAEACHVTVAPTIEAVLNRLRAIADTKATDESTVVGLQRLYRRLALMPSYEDDLMRAAFEDGALIFAGAEHGGWLKRENACWHVDGALGRHCQLRGLATTWETRAPELKNFFVRKLEVPESLTPQAWLQVLRSIRVSQEPIDRARGLVRLAYRALAVAVARPDGKSVLNEFRVDPLLYCTDGRWRVIRGQAPTIVFSDDPAVEAHFTGQPGVAFVCVDPRDRVDIEPLFRALGIKALREAMTIASTGGVCDDDTSLVAERLRKRMLALARVLYHDAKRLFHAAHEDGFFAFLAGARVVVSPHLQVTVGDVTVNCKFRAKVLGDGEQRTLHLGQAEMGTDVWIAIGHALADELGVDRKDGTLIGTLLACADAEAVERILEDNDVHLLPIEAEQRLPIFAGERHARIDATPPLSPATSERHGEPAIRDEPRTAERSEQVGLSRLRATEPTDDGPDSVEERTAAVPPRDASTRSLEVLEPAQAGRSASLRSSPSAPRPRQARLGTYAAADAPPRDELLIREVDAAATRLVMQYEREQGRTPVDMNVHHPDHPGFDIRSTGPGDGEIRYIEVKGTDDRWETRGVDVTKTQIRHALEHPDQSWLYVVEFARGPHAKIHRIRDFASKVERIAFDGGWRDFAEP
jgi:hypothetical protein